MLCNHTRPRGCPYGPMDKAPAYGAGDSGFESQYGLIFFVSLPLKPVVPTFLIFCLGRTANLSLVLTLRGSISRHSPDQKKGGDARIELATSCTRSRNHTTRPITRRSAVAGRATPLAPKRERDVLELNQRPIGLQPIALPLS